MGDDLIERLRGLLDGGVAAAQACADGGCVECAERLEAADRIEQLEEAVRRLDVLLGVCSNAARSGIDSWCSVHRCFVPDDLPQGERVCEARWVLGQIAGSGTDR